MTRYPVKVTFTKQGENKYQMSLEGELLFMDQKDVDYALAHPDLYEVTVK